jgi:fatty acid desaturase
VTQTPDLLASDADRARVATQLREHYESGRLTLEEFQERLDETHRARTEAQLERVLRQLPSPKLPTVNPRDRRWRSLALQYALVNVIAVLIWVFSGGNGDFWPKWVLVVTLFMFTRRAFGRRYRQALPRPPRPPRL